MSRLLLIKRNELKESENKDSQQFRKLKFQLNNKLIKRKKPENSQKSSGQNLLLKRKRKPSMMLLSKRLKLKELLKLQLRGEQRRPLDWLLSLRQMLKNKRKLPVCPSVKLPIICVLMMVKSKKKNLKSKKRLKR